MKPKLNLFLVILVIGSACLSLGQVGGGGGGGAGFGGGRQRGGRGNNTSITRLVFRSDVQADLALTDEEKTKLEGMRDSLRGPQRAQGEPRPTAEERAATEEANAKKIEEVLTPDQVRRLHEIQFQIMGAAALRMKRVQADLGLSADQVSKLDTIFATYESANRSVQTKVTNKEIDPSQAQSDREKNMAELKTESEKVLTAEQLAKFQAMGGKHFESTVPARG
jgi:hypothetical protein